MSHTCSQVLWRSESQVCTITLAVSAVSHEAKAREPRIAILQTPNANLRAID